MTSRSQRLRWFVADTYNDCRWRFMFWRADRQSSGRGTGIMENDCQMPRRFLPWRARLWRVVTFRAVCGNAVRKNHYTHRYRPTPFVEQPVGAYPRDAEPLPVVADFEERRARLERTRAEAVAPLPPEMSMGRFAELVREEAKHA